MIIYRPHRELFEDAMAEAQEFETVDAMKEYIVKENQLINGAFPFSVDDIVISDESVDDIRNGWKDTRHVCIKRYLREDFMEKYGVAQCIGMCATDYKR